MVMIFGAHQAMRRMDEATAAPERLCFSGRAAVSPFRARPTTTWTGRVATLGRWIPRLPRRAALAARLDPLLAASRLPTTPRISTFALSTPSLSMAPSLSPRVLSFAAPSGATFPRAAARDDNRPLAASQRQRAGEARRAVWALGARAPRRRAFQDFADDPGIVPAHRATSRATVRGWQDQPFARRSSGEGVERLRDGAAQFAFPWNAIWSTLPNRLCRNSSDKAARIDAAPWLDINRRLAARTTSSRLDRRASGAATWAERLGVVWAKSWKSLESRPETGIELWRRSLERRADQIERRLDEAPASDIGESRRGVAYFD